MKLCNFTRLRTRQALLTLAMLVLPGLMATVLAQGTFKFAVRDQQTGFSVQDAKVLIYTEAGKGASPVSVHESNNLELNLQEGYYRFVFQAPGYDKLETYFLAEDGRSIEVKAMMDPIAPTSAQYKRLAAGRQGNTPAVAQDKVVIEGYVADKATGMPLQGVEVNIGNRTGTTDAGGYFQVELPASQKSLEAREHTGVIPEQSDIIFKKEGYRRHETTGFYMLPDTYSLRIELEKGDAGSRTAPVSEQYKNGMYANKSEEAPEKDNGFRNPFLTSESNAATAPPMPSSIRVGMSCSSCSYCASVSVISFETYVQQGLDNEWISGWNANSLRAGAVAYRTYGAYHTVYPYAANYDITSNTCRQAFGTETATSTINAAIYTAGKVMLSGSAFAFAEYSAENNNSGCGNGYSGDYTNYPCISDNLCSGQASYGHGRGMCQWGSSRWANSGYGYEWILDHYYNPAGIYRSTGSSSGGSNIALNATPYAYSSQYSATYAPAKALDGNISTKWVSDGSGTYSDMYLNLNGVYNINKFVLKHAGAGGEWSAMNTENYSIFYWNGSSWQQLLNYVNSGQANTTQHTVSVQAQFVYLAVYDPGVDNYTRLPEWEIYGSSAGARAESQTPPGLDGVESQLSITAFPNPAEDKVQVNFSKARTLPYEISLTDVQGRKVYSEKVAQPDHDTGTELNVSGLQSGVYLISVSGAEGSETIRCQVK